MFRSLFTLSFLALALPGCLVGWDGYEPRDTAEPCADQNLDGDSADDTGDTTEVEDTGSDTGDACTYELYVVGLSQEAIDQGYELGWNCFPTAPSFTGADIMIGGMETPTDITYYTFIQAMPEGNVVVDSVGFDITLEDNGGTGWGTTLNSLNEYASRISGWYTETSGHNPVDLGVNIPAHDDDRFGVNVGTPDVTIPAGEDRWVWINLHVGGLPITAGDTVTFTGSTRITWHSDTVPEVMTMADPLDEEVASYTYTFPE